MEHEIIDNNRFNSIITEAYNEYFNKYLGYYDVPDINWFLNEIMTNSEFAKTQGLLIENINLTLDERIKLFYEKGFIPNIDSLELVSKGKIIIKYKNKSFEKIN